jgi:hypothetical protein
MKWAVSYKGNYVHGHADLSDRHPVTRHATLPGTDAMKRMPQEVLAQLKREESVKTMRKRRESLDVL